MTYSLLRLDPDQNPPKSAPLMQINVQRAGLA
jgi:hypothetical protein